MGFLYNMEATNGFERRKLRDPLCFMRRPLPAGATRRLGDVKPVSLGQLCLRNRIEKLRILLGTWKRGPELPQPLLHTGPPLDGMNDGAQE